ncbi:MAG: 2-isopropylmalate synthase [Bacteroidetes bacterium]|nr:2-isopropylmalate synthase [Bacteroidota bacterium]MBU1116092.1 2-isopropylmalate synthase [Bacteroidota bacterium]MBU1799484.1 2-isopropylmalate synthase [Bacteroidota bacterium]
MLQILDSTLREGEQTPGVYFDKHIKLAIAKMLDDIGVDIIETGHPSVTQEIHDSVQIIAHNNFKAIVGAHARSLKDDVQLALNCGVDFIGIFYCVSDDRLNTVFKKDLAEAIIQITDVIKFAKSQNPDIIIRYTPEDTVRSEFSNVVAVSIAAVEAGADIISVADTTGYMIPGTDRSMFDYISKLKYELNSRGLNPKIAVHCHNDRGFALANALDAYRAGAEIIDASVLGLGERAGIVDLAQIMMVLTADFGLNNWKLDKLDELYQFVSSHSGVPIPGNYPIIGKHAFTHCAGVHTHAAAINPTHYESLDPQLLGKERTFSLDHMSGIASIKYALSFIGETKLSPELQLEVLAQVKNIGQKGKVVELTELPHIVHFIKQNYKHKQKSK